MPLNNCRGPAVTTLASKLCKMPHCILYYTIVGSITCCAFEASYNFTLTSTECPRLWNESCSVHFERGEADQQLQVTSMAPGQAGSFPWCPAATNLLSPSECLFGSVNYRAPDGRFVDMITRLGSRIDDILAGSQSAAPREALICLFNLFSGASN